MKLPKRPPEFPIESGKLADFIMTPLAAAQSALMDDADLRQLNWEEVEHRAKARGLDAVFCWHQLRFWRRARSKSFGLSTVDGRRFNVRVEPWIQRQLREIDLNLGGAIGHDHHQLGSEEDRNRYLLTALADEAIDSSRLEGAVTTREQAREMIRQNRDPKSEHERMVLNNYHAMRRLSEWKNQPLSMGLLLEIHRTLTEGTMPREDQSGRLRTASENVNVWDDFDQQVLHSPPAAELLPTRLALMIDWANQPDDADPVAYLHPAVKAILLHFWLANEHPFVDGNGRTARTLFYWGMLRRGYWLTEYIPISTVIARQKRQYARAFLNTELDGEDLNYFLVNQLRVLDLAIADFKSHLERRRKERERLTAIVGAARFNGRQQALLTRALKDSATRFTYRSHANSHGITLATARTDLLELEQVGLLVGNRRGRSFEFVAAPGLEVRLHQLR